MASSHEQRQLALDVATAKNPLMPNHEAKRAQIKKILEDKCHEDRHNKDGTTCEGSSCPYLKHDTCGHHPDSTVYASGEADQINLHIYPPVEVSSPRTNISNARQTSPGDDFMIAGHLNMTTNLISYKNVKNYIDTEDNWLKLYTDTETNRATERENNLQTQINSEQSARASGDSSITQTLNAHISRTDIHHTHSGDDDGGGGGVVGGGGSGNISWPGNANEVLRGDGNVFTLGPNKLLGTDANGNLNTFSWG